MFGCACCQPSPPPQKRTKGQSKENLVAENNNQPKTKAQTQKKSPPKSSSKSPSKSTQQVHTNQGFEAGERQQRQKPKTQESRQLNPASKASAPKAGKSVADPHLVTVHVPGTSGPARPGTSGPAGPTRIPEPRNEKLDPKMEAQLGSLISRLEVVTNRLESVSPTDGAGGGAGGAPEEVAQFVVEFDEIINGPLAQFLANSNKIGGDVQTQGAVVGEAFTAQRQFLVTASKCKQPSQDALGGLLMPTSQKIQAIQDFREKNRGSKQFNHLSTISETIPALGWVAVSPTPGPYVKEMSDAGQFFANRVLKDFREKDKTHVEWVKNWSSIWAQLQAYIKKYHTTGVTWNRQGADAGSLAPKAAAPPPAPAVGGPPPPPPPPAVEPPAGGAPSGESGSGKRAQLFADLNKGADVTKSLKKVTDDMKTHKNPSLKLQTPQPYKPNPQASPKPFKPFKPGGAVAKTETVKPPKCALEGKKWLVEHQSGNKNLVLKDVEMKQTVYIYKCLNSTVQVQGKVNSITLDSCKKVGLVFTDVVSCVEVVNSQSVQAQVTGKMPTISIDKTDGIMVYLSEESVRTEIVTAKSSEMNILVPTGDGDYKEFALPEQFKTQWNGKKFVTEKTDIAA